MLLLSEEAPCAGVRGGEDAAAAIAEEEEDDGDRETLHRLCPTYATDINSPLRHVRTRIYFTSESHMHSLINVLRYSHCGAPPRPDLCRKVSLCCACY